MLARSDFRRDASAFPPARHDEQLKFTDAMRKLAGGVIVITGTIGDETLAMTATAICSVSADPPSLLTCVNKSASIQQALHVGAAFGVNVLHESDIDVARDCAGRAPQKARACSPAWIANASGPPLLRGALATFECRVTERIEQGSHVIVIGQALRWNATTGGRPLIYFDCGYRELGGNDERE